MSGQAPTGTPNGGAPAVDPAATPAPATPAPAAPAAPAPATPAPATPATPPVDPLKIEPPAAPTEPQALLEFDAITAEWTEKGELSEDTLKTIEAKGIPRAYVDVYMAGLASLQQQAASSVYSVAGGEGNYKAMVGWATANLSAAEIEAYNNAMTGSNETRALAAQGLFAKFSAANGSEGQTLSGTTTGSTPSYASWDEVKTAMKDKRYGKDRSYTAEVQAKLKVSKL